MKIERGKPHKVRAKSPKRYALQGTMIDKAHGVAIGTDGRAMVIVPVAIEDGDKNAPDRAIFTEAAMVELTKRDALGATWDSDEVTVVRRSVTTTHGTVEGRFPQYEDIVRSAPQRNSPNGETVRVGLNAKILWNLSQALEAEEIELTIPVGKASSAMSPILVSPARENTANLGGIIMPVSLMDKVYDPFEEIRKG